MKSDKYRKLRKLIELRENAAAAKLGIARKVLLESEEELASAEEDLVKTKSEGLKAVSDFLSGDYNVGNNYASRLSSLRSLAAQVDYDIHLAQTRVEDGREAIGQAEYEIEERKNEYRLAVQRLEKAKHLSDKFSREDEQLDSNRQEADILDSYTAVSADKRVL